jgi:hypothetical protein
MDDEKFYNELLKIAGDVREIQADLKHQLTREQLETVIGQRQENFNEKIISTRQHADSRIDQTNKNFSARIDDLAESLRGLEKKMPAIVDPIAAAAVKAELKDQDARMTQARRSFYTSAGIGAAFVALGILDKMGVL